MDELRIHGQGSITATEMLMVLAFKDGEYAQAFPAIGVGRHGAKFALFIPGK